MNSLISCIIIDDEQPAINVLNNYITRLPALDLKATFTNPNKALDYILKNTIDLIFLDIQMDALNGIEVMRRIPPDRIVIFCTAYSEFALDGFELNATDYLLKPISFERFEKSVCRALDKLKIKDSIKQIDHLNNDFVLVKAEQKGKLKKIKLTEILFIEGKGNYVSFNLENEKVLSMITMKELEDILPSSQFMRVHKSFIVSLNNIQALESGLLILSKSISVPLSLTYRAMFLQKMRNKIISR